MAGPRGPWSSSLGWPHEDRITVCHGIREGDPPSARAWVDRESVLRRARQGSFRIVTHGQMTCDAATLFVDDTLTVYEGEDDAWRETFSRSWH